MNINVKYILGKRELFPTQESINMIQEMRYKPKYTKDRFLKYSLTNLKRICEFIINENNILSITRVVANIYSHKSNRKIRGTVKSLLNHHNKINNDTVLILYFQMGAKPDVNGVLVKNGTNKATFAYLNDKKCKAYFTKSEDFIWWWLWIPIGVGVLAMITGIGMVVYLMTKKNQESAKASYVSVNSLD